MSDNAGSGRQHYLGGEGGVPGARYGVTTVEHDVVMYGSACPACTQATAVLDHYGVAYQLRSIDELPRRHGRARSMPQITIDDELLGGINELLKLARSGGLQRLTEPSHHPWIRVRHRLGRGYDVQLLDQLGRVQRHERAATRGQAEAIKDRLTAS